MKSDHSPDTCVVAAAASSSSSSHRTRIRNPRKKRTIINMDDDNNVVLKPKKPDISGAPKITRPCTECGKTFWSWKALFGHMRCHPERQWRGINPPPNLSRQPKQMTQEDNEVAACLLLLANAKGKKATVQDHHMTEESPSTVSVCSQQQQEGGFECSSCKKVFGSHQALGGHRASHKNVKGCFARTEHEEDHHIIHNIVSTIIMDDLHDNDNNNNIIDYGGHKCSICLRVFSTGQALGGHKRCHWDKAGPPPPTALDLNLPPPPSPSPSPPLALELRLGL